MHLQNEDVRSTISAPANAASTLLHFAAIIPGDSLLFPQHCSASTTASLPLSLLVLLCPPRAPVPSLSPHCSPPSDRGPHGRIPRRIEARPWIEARMATAWRDPPAGRGPHVADRDAIPYHRHLRLPLGEAIVTLQDVATLAGLPSSAAPCAPR
jgi:hypothetical protein